MNEAARAPAHATTMIVNTRRQRRRYGRTSALSGSSESACDVGPMKESRPVIDGTAGEGTETGDHALQGEVSRALSRERARSVETIGGIHPSSDRSRQRVRRTR